MVAAPSELAYPESAVSVETIEGRSLGPGCNDCGAVLSDVVASNDRSLLAVECRCNSLLDLDAVLWRRIPLISQCY
jgi:hypothetical protein